MPSQKKVKLIERHLIPPVELHYIMSDSFNGRLPKITSLTIIEAKKQI